MAKTTTKEKDSMDRDSFESTAKNSSLYFVFLIKKGAETLVTSNNNYWVFTLPDTLRKELTKGCDTVATPGASSFFDPGLFSAEYY